MNAAIQLIPQPKKVIIKQGCFDLKNGAAAIAVQLDNRRFRHAGVKLTDCICELTGKTLPVVQSDTGAKNRITLRVSLESSAAESYRLTIGRNGIMIEAEGFQGLFRGVQTLMQLMQLSGPTVPCIEISDAPDFPVRGFYHDVTRGKVPTLTTLKTLVDKLAFYKINQLQLYIEHTFAFRDLPELWRGKDPLTSGEITELDAYCRDNCIDLVPSLATFGHLYELLRLKRFEHLNELDIKASELPYSLWDRMAHYTIDVSREESFTLIKSMIDEFVPLFSSRYCNICCDETFDLGKGRNLQKAAKVGIGRLYVDFVKKIAGVVHVHGKQPMLWGDMILRNPDLIPELPGDTVFLNWGYGADVTADAARAFSDARVTQYVCPGVQGWSRFANDMAVASENIRKMVHYGKEYGAAGVLTTDWGDCGHVNFLANSFHGMALGAALSWNTTSYQEDGAFDAAISAIEWGDRTGAVAKRLRELGELCFYHFGNMYAWVNNIRCPWDREEGVRNADPSAIARSYGRASKIAAFFETLSASKDYLGDPQDIAEFICSAKAVRWTLALLALKKRSEYNQLECKKIYKSKTKLLEEGAALLERFELLWRKRNKDSELRNVTETFIKIFDRIEKMNDC